MKGVIFTPQLIAKLYAIGKINAAAALLVTNSVNNTVIKNYKEEVTLEESEGKTCTMKLILYAL